jgi:TonB family protein
MLRPARLSLVLLTAAAFVRTATAQQALYAEHNGEFQLVRHVYNHTPYVEENGKSVPASASKYGFRKVPEYAPFYVAIRHLQVATRQLEVADIGAELNKEFSFRAEFESAYPLENVFVALDLDTEKAGKTLFIQEVGDLAPHVPRSVEMLVPLTSSLGPGQYHVHVFSQGAELFHSEMPFDYIEGQLDIMVAKRVEGKPDGPPQPFIGPAPEYPEKLRRQKVKGNATVRLEITPTGRVRNPTLKSASAPEFGEAALVAARQWRFLPAIKNGVPTAKAVQMPFLFEPDAPHAPDGK